MITLAGEFKPGLSRLRISTRGLGRDVKFFHVSVFAFSNLIIFQQSYMQLSTELKYGTMESTQCIYSESKTAILFNNLGC
jgi:hypothetical protein